MLQIAQYQKNGEIEVLDLPIPNCIENGILVRTAYSIISAGTEKTSVNNAKGSLLSRAQKQPDQVKLVIDTIKKQGLRNTIFRIQNKLNSYKQIGYSLSGIVVESKCSEFRPGDRVACGGAGYANHSEYVTVPKNLAVKIPDNVNYIDAAYTTIASIAVQGVRQADVRLGENVAVIGLGLLGQITVRLLKASGCNVIGLDINEELFGEAIKSGCSLVLPSNNLALNQIKAFTTGIGCDAVIITAGTSSSSPLNLAMQITRQRGNVVVVGAIGMNLNRNPFYTKEINLKISCSYGPGRYDPNYEELGQDYPAGYVRWTENRNMQSFLGLLSNNSMNVSDFTTHIFKPKDVPKAYKIVTGEVTEKFIGIAINYDLDEHKILNDYRNQVAKIQLEKNLDLKNNKEKNTNQLSNKIINVGFIGAGQFASNYILPVLNNSKSVKLSNIVNNSPISSVTVAKQFNFTKVNQNYDELFIENSIDLVFCATRHNIHSEIVCKALEQDKYIFVEKPLAVNENELNQILEIGKSKNNLHKIMVGFNRRFSDAFKTIEKVFQKRSEPMIVSYRVNAGYIPKSHWTQQLEQGQRIIGEACHFFDVMLFLIKSRPVRVFAESLSINTVDKNGSDNVIVTVKFTDGSLGKLEYLSNGDNSLPKEYCEVFCEGRVAIMDNFTNVKIYNAGKLTESKFSGEKGIVNEINKTIENVNKGIAMPIEFQDLFDVTNITFAVIKSLNLAKPITLS